MGNCYKVIVKWGYNSPILGRLTLHFPSFTTLGHFNLSVGGVGRALQRAEEFFAASLFPLRSPSACDPEFLPGDCDHSGCPLVVIIVYVDSPKLLCKGDKDSYPLSWLLRNYYAIFLATHGRHFGLRKSFIYGPTLYGLLLYLSSIHWASN